MMLLQGLSAPPRLWPSATDGHRRVTWIELFFDLIFVAAVAQVGAPLAADYSAAGLVRYAFLFVLIWWAWSGHTLYTTRFDHDDTIQRLLVLVQCFIAAVMAANAKDALDSRSSAGFGAAYAGMRTILVIQYLRARRLSDTRALTTRYAVGFGAAALLWMLSAVCDAPARYWIWALALTVDFATPWVAAPHCIRFPPDAAHFPERFGLFTIILLGEFVASVMRGIEHQEYWSVPAALTAFLSMTFGFVVRGWYFDVASSASERHVRGRRETTLFQIWHYAHLPLFLGIGVAGVGFERLISLSADERLSRSEVIVLFAAVATLTLALTLIGATSERAGREGSPQVSGQLMVTGALAAAGLLVGGVHRVLLAFILVTFCAVQTLLGNPRRIPHKQHRTAA